MGASSGLIIAFVVAVWAAYFVPLALRRYDEAGKNASVESSGTLSRIIHRPEPAVAETAAPTTEAPRRTLDRPAARLAARRRRRTLLTILGLTAIVAVLAATSVVAPVWVAAPVTLLVAWLVACRVQVRRELGIARPKAPRKPRTAKAPKAAKAPKTVSRATPRDEEETVVVSGHHEDLNPGRKHQMEDVPLEAEALDDQIVIAVPSVSTTGEALWDPLPVTLPTYVTKPRVGRTVRTIDFGQAGAWTSGHIEGEDVVLPGRRDDAGDERRAVGH